MSSTLDKLNTGMETGSLLNAVEEKPEETSLIEDAVDVFRGATNQFGLMPVAQGVMSATFDPLATALGSKATADANLDLSDKNILERTLERFKYGYNQNKEQQKESMERSPLLYNSANIAGGMVIPGGAVGKLATKPIGLALSKAPVVGKVGTALTKEGGVLKSIADNAVEGALDSAMFSEDGEAGSSALMGATFGSAVPVLGATGKKLVPKVAGLLGGNLNDLEKYSKKYPEIAKDLKTANAKMDEIENAVETSTKKLNDKYDSDLHKLGSSIADDTKKIGQEQEKLTRDVRNQLVDAYNTTEDKIMKHSYKARGNLRDDAFIDISDIQKKVDDAFKESQIKGKSYSASNDTSMKSIEQIRNDLLEIAKDGRISEKDLWRYMHDVLSPLSKYSNKDLKDYVPPATAIARVLRHDADDLLKTANPKYQKAMKPTAEMTQFIRKELPDAINLDSKGSLGLIRTLESNPETFQAIKKLLNYAGTKSGKAVNKNLDRIFKIEKNLPSSFVGKDNLQMTGYLNKPGEGISVEQMQDTLRRFDDINGTDYSKQLATARKEGKRDTLEAYQQLRFAENATDTDKKGKSFVRKAFGMLEPDEITGKQSWFSKTVKGNEANPLNERLLKDRKAKDALNLISDITGMDKKELERFGRNIALDKALDTSTTNGSRNTRFGAAVGGGLLGLGQYAYDSLNGDNNKVQPANWYDKLPISGTSIGSLLGALVGGIKDYGLANRLGKAAIRASYSSKPKITKYDTLNNVLDNAPQSIATRLNGVLERRTDSQKAKDNELDKYRAEVTYDKFGRRIVSPEDLQKTKNIREDIFKRED